MRISEEQHAEHHDLGQQRPIAGIADIEPANIVERHTLPPLAARRAWRFSGAVRLERFGSAQPLHLQVERELIDSFCLSSGTDLISTSSGEASQGELSMLRISVETRALDCA